MKLFQNLFFKKHPSLTINQPANQPPAPKSECGYLNGGANCRLYIGKFSLTGKLRNSCRDTGKVGVGGGGGGGGGGGERTTTLISIMDK